MPVDNITPASTGGVEDMSFDSLDFSTAGSAEPIADVVDDTPEVVEEPKGEEVEKESEESSEEGGEEKAEEPVKEEPSKEFIELQAKAEKAERKLKKAIERIRETEAKVSQAEAHISALKGEGLDASMAKELVVAKKSGNYGKVWEMLGFDANEVVKTWAKELGWTPEQQEEVQIHVKRKQAEEEIAQKRRQIEEEKARIEQERAKVSHTNMNTIAERFTHKMADKYPVIGTLEGKAVDQLRATVAEFVRNNDPRIRSCETFEDALKVVAPIVEKKLYKESLKAYEAVKKIKERAEKGQDKSSAQKDKPKATAPTKPEKEAKGSAQPQSNGKPAPTPKSKLTEKERLDYELSKLDFSGK